MVPSAESTQRDEVRARFKTALDATLKYYGTLMGVPSMNFAFGPRQDIINAIRAHLERIEDLSELAPVSLEGFPTAEGGEIPNIGWLDWPFVNIDWPIKALQIALAEVKATTWRHEREGTIADALVKLDAVIAWKTTAPTLGHDGQVLHPRLAEHIRTIAHEQGCFGRWVTTFEHGKIVARMGDDPSGIEIIAAHRILYIEESCTWIFQSDEAQHRMERVAELERERVTAALAVTSAQFDLSIVLMSKDPMLAMRAFELLAERRNKEQLVVDLEERIIQHLRTIQREQRKSP